MRLLKQQHAQSGLPDSPANREGQFSRHHFAVIAVGKPVRGTGDFQLTFETFGVDANAHGRNFQTLAQHFVVKEYVAVQAPIVVIGRSAVVRLAVGQRAADVHKEHRAVTLCDFRLSGMRVQVRKLVKQFLRGDELDFSAKCEVDCGKRLFCLLESVDYCADYALHHHFEKFGRALFLGYHHFPVPLVDVNGVRVVALVVAANGVHVGVKTFTVAESVFFERRSLPFRKRMHDFGLAAALFQNIETDGSLYSVQIVVDSAFAPHEKRCGHAFESEILDKISLKRVLDEFDGFLRFANAHLLLVFCRQRYKMHSFSFSVLTP